MPTLFRLFGNCRFFMNWFILNNIFCYLLVNTIRKYRKKETIKIIFAFMIDNC